MHKHRQSNKSGGDHWRNANSRLPESASDFIRNLPREIAGEEHDYFAALYLKQEFLSKFLDEDIVPARDRMTNAINKWTATESKNGVTNAILRERDPGYNIIPRVTYSSFLKFARRLLSDILGPLHCELVLGSYSGGASTSHRRTRGHPAFKFAEQADTTEAARIYVDTLYRLSPLLRQYGTFNYLREVEGAILFTVPKKTDIDRCACKEPTFNMYLQKGVGDHIRKRLRRFGINLNDQSVNRSLAAIGAKDNSLATIDLSSASDTITIEAVRTLLPTDWFEYLNDIRSQSVSVGGVHRRTEMFSSMGNGFTFELESLLFYVLSRTTLYFEGITGVVSVYGDDIIIPAKGYDMVTWVLHSFGFTVNEDKSFHDGPFRESCGGHYHHTEDVTPFYLKRKATHMTDVIRVANQLRFWALADASRQYMLPATYNVWLKLANYVPKVLWGGSDFNSDTSLVSPGFPNKQLSRLSDPRNLPNVGRYLHWQNTFWKRTFDPKPGSLDVDTRLRCRLSRVRNGAPYSGDYFRQEIDPGFGLE